MSFLSWLKDLFMDDPTPDSVLLTVMGVQVFYVGGRGYYTSCAQIDGDGSGEYHGDPDFQPDTSLHDREGRALNADLVPYIVLPPRVIDLVGPVVLGCRARVTDTRTGKSVDAVVGDVGPRSKIGEMSIACAKSLGIPDSPTTGGEDAKVFLYEFWPGIPATVNGITYPLQAA